MGRLSEEPDEVLFSLLKQNSDKAFAVLFHRYWDKMLEISLQKLHSQDDAEEVLQDVFLSIWNTRHQTILKYTFRTYLSASLKYRIYAKFAERAKHQATAIDGIMADTLPDNATQNWLDFDEIRKEIETLVAQLPEKCRMVFELSRNEGMTTKEIASKMEISEKTVEGHITKALKHLKNNLNLGIFSLLLFIYR
ncbi:RNA polymerase sigma-70 factor [Pedobacter sp. AW31-3R]|uniref:RNA polymerase sigma-70 factor n=1 Tax=Pedobacter sp. AW31-3R TaxID=3445781 RepID=UPI003FA0F432